MRSVLNLPEKQIGDQKALNFILVCYGEAEKVQEAVSHLQKRFRARIKAQSVSCYDLSVLDRAHGHPELLSKTNDLTFRGADHRDKEYLGYFDCHDIEKLHRHLFQAPEAHFPILIPPSPPYYTQNHLLQLLSTPSEGTDVDSDKANILDDFGVKYHYEKLDSEKSYAIIKHYINSVCLEEDLTEPLLWFDSMIKEMDADFPDVFRSAYISYHDPGLAILHETVYNSGYDLHALDRFVLGLEWSVYFSGRILQNTGDAALQDLADTVFVHPCQNGCQYKAREDIRQFKNSTRNKLSYALRELLIPAFGLYRWEDVYLRAQTFAMYLPQTVSVYFDRFSPQNPDIAFSYHLALDEIEEYVSVHGLNKEDLIARFQKRADHGNRSLHLGD